MDEDAMRAFEEDMAKLQEATMDVVATKKQTDIENDSDYDTDIDIPGNVNLFFFF